MTHGFKGRYSNSCRKIFKEVEETFSRWFHGSSFSGFSIVSFLSSCYTIELNGCRFVGVLFEIYVKARTCVRDRTWAHQLWNRKRAIGGSFTKTGSYSYKTATSYKTKRKYRLRRRFLSQSELESCRHFFCNIFITYCFSNVRKHDFREIRNYVYSIIRTYICVIYLASLVIDKESLASRVTKRHRAFKVTSSKIQ